MRECLVCNSFSFAFIFYFSRFTSYISWCCLWHKHNHWKHWLRRFSVRKSRAANIKICIYSIFIFSDTLLLNNIKVVQAVYTWSIFVLLHINFIYFFILLDFFFCFLFFTPFTLFFTLHSLFFFAFSFTCQNDNSRKKYFWVVMRLMRMRKFFLFFIFLILSKDNRLTICNKSVSFFSSVNMSCAKFSYFSFLLIKNLLFPFFLFFAPTLYNIFSKFLLFHLSFLYASFLDKDEIFLCT